MKAALSSYQMAKQYVEADCRSATKKSNFPGVVARYLISCRVLLIIYLTLSALKSLSKSTQSSVSVQMLLIFYLKVEKEIVNSGVTYK